MKVYYGKQRIPQLPTVSGRSLTFIVYDPTLETHAYRAVFSNYKYYYKESDDTLRPPSGTSVTNYWTEEDENGELVWVLRNTTAYYYDNGSKYYDEDTPYLLWTNYDFPLNSASGSIWRPSDGVATPYGAAQTAIVSSGKSISLSINAYADTFILAVLASRADQTTPDGWELIHMSSVQTSGSNHRVGLYKKAIETKGSYNFTATFGTSARMHLNLLTMNDISDVVYHDGSEHLWENTVFPYTVDRPNYDSVLWFCKTNIWGTSHYWAIDNDSFGPIAGPSSIGTRLVNFVDESDSETVTFSSTMNSATYTIIDSLEVIRKSDDYNSEGTTDFSKSLTDITEYGTSIVSWEEDTPDGTTLEVYSKLDDGEFKKCTNGEALPILEEGADYSDSTLYLQARLSTENLKKTPSIWDLAIRVSNKDDDNVVLLNFPSGVTNGIQRAVGDVTVRYSGGTLAGAGGPVQDFEQVFTPEGLDPKNNPNDIEHVEVKSVTVNPVLTKIFYSSGYTNEHVAISSVEVNAVLTNIKDI